VRRDVDRAMEFLEQAADAGRPAAGFLLNMVLTSE
jgi:TPR repeat protein